MIHLFHHKLSAIWYICMCVYVCVLCEAAVPLWLEHWFVDREVASLMPSCCCCFLEQEILLWGHGNSWENKCQAVHVALTLVAYIHHHP